MNPVEALYSETNGQVEQDGIPEFIPTVFVGLGGSGKSTLMRLRKQFHDRYTTWGSKFDRFARFVFIDTDRSEFAPRDDKNKMFTDVLPREAEIVESTIRRARFEQIFRNLDLHVESEHLQWLKSSMQTVTAGAVEDGAGTHRQFGRLAFFENYAAIRQQIEAQIREVLAYATQNAATVASDRIEVVIMTSLAGGTGSGMFLDVAYLVRHILSQTNFQGLRIQHVTLIAYLPEMFRSTPAGASKMPRLRQNAYAALLELEYYGTPRTGDALFLGEEMHAGRDGRHGFRAIWPGEGEVFFPSRGWDTLFLVDNVNSLNSTNPLTEAEVVQMTADYLFLDFGETKFATEKRSARSNLVQYKDRWKATWIRRLADPSAPPGQKNKPENIFATQSGCIYSSFGLAEIFFDVDNLYQVAGYRLASRLVDSRWIGPPEGLTAETFKQWADRDLLYPEPAGDQAGSPIVFHPNGISREAYVLDGKDWLVELDAELERLESTDEEEAADELGVMLARHRLRLTAGGEARRTIAQNVANWKGTETVLGPWRRRLQQLADRSLSTHGVEATKALLEAYRDLLIEVRQKVAEARPGNLAPTLLSRLEEAKIVPFPVRPIARRIELTKARNLAREELKKHYDAIGQGDAESALVSAIRYVGEPGQGAPEGISTNDFHTLQEWMEKVTRQLRAIGARLEARFAVASQGRDLVNHRKQSLTVVWDEARYDRKINQSMLLYSKVGRDPKKPEGTVKNDDPKKFEFEFDWARLEKLVRDEYREVERRAREREKSGMVDQDIPAGSLAELARHWEANRLVNPPNIEKIAQRLAEACESVIRAAGLKLADVEHGNVADLLSNAKLPQQRDQIVEQLVVSAAPYLPTIDRANDAIQPANHNLFGLSVGGQATSESNVNAITELVEDTAANRQPGGVAHFGGRLEADQSSALFVRMMAGFPIQAYSRLEDLYRAYMDPRTNTRNNDECHIDYKQSWEDLPDIRAVASDTYFQVRENVDIVLLNMMIGVISYPKDKGGFHVLIPDPYGAGEDYQNLGKRISRAIKHACDDDAIRAYLAERWAQWSDKATVKAWACLYESALRTLNESRKDIPVGAGKNEGVPFRNCYGGLLRMIAKKLDEADGGKPWLEALRPQPGRGEGDGAGKKRARPVDIDPALQRIHENLKIYQLIPSKVEQVHLPEPEPEADAVAPSA